jgi:hypothetical protein
MAKAVLVTEDGKRITLKGTNIERARKMFKDANIYSEDRPIPREGAIDLSELK